MIKEIIRATIVASLFAFATPAFATTGVAPDVSTVQTCPTGWYNADELNTTLNKNTLKAVGIISLDKLPTGLGGTSMDDVLGTAAENDMLVQKDQITAYILVDGTDLEFAVPMNKDGCVLAHYGLPVKDLKNPGLGV